MKIAIESTGLVTTIEGVPVRLWEGVTERGTRCQVFVHRIAVHDSQDSSQFEQELKECLPPAVFVDLGRILLDDDEEVWIYAWPEDETQACRVCGCTNERACPGGCYWVAPDLCSRCAEELEKV